MISEGLCDTEELQLHIYIYKIETVQTVILSTYPRFDQ